jgi:ABC-type glycerol-3-phosphate transport system substrate-binding protein
MGMNMDNVFSFVVPMMKGSAVTKPFQINGFTLTAMAVPQTSKHQDAAWDFINLIALDPEGVPAFANGAYIIPAAKLDAAAVSRLDPAIQAMYNSLVDDRNVTTIVDNDPENIGRRLPHEELYKDMQRMVLGEMSAEQAAANYDANIAAQWAAGRQ